MSHAIPVMVDASGVGAERPFQPRERRLIGPPQEALSATVGRPVAVTVVVDVEVGKR